MEKQDIREAEEVAALINLLETTASSVLVHINDQNGSER
jgi:hypothetical protein